MLSLPTGELLVAPADRADVFIAAAMAAVNKTALAGMVLTGDTELPPGPQAFAGRP